jgi:tetratricopeptide (TPR) repeat protein
MVARFKIILLSSLAAIGPLVSEAQVKTQAQIILEDLQVRQNRIFEAYAKEQNPIDKSSMESRLYAIRAEYQSLFSKNENNLAVLVTYGLFLAQIDQRENSLKLLLKADSLDPTNPKVKNQLGNFMTEEASYALGLPYYLGAIKLAPKEPLYHYQLGNLLFYFRKHFVKDGILSESHLNKQMLDAFKNAAELGSDNLAYRYRYAESFYDIPDADMEEALREWKDIENSTYSETDKQIVRLHQANVYLMLGRKEMVPLLLDQITDPKYDDNKEKILKQLREESD